LTTELVHLRLDYGTGTPDPRVVLALRLAEVMGSHVSALRSPGLGVAKKLKKYMKNMVNPLDKSFILW